MYLIGISVYVLNRYKILCINCFDNYCRALEKRPMTSIKEQPSYMEELVVLILLILLIILLIIVILLTDLLL